MRNRDAKEEGYPEAFELGEIYLGKIVAFPPAMIIWAGYASDHLYAILSDGRTYRLDKFIAARRWTLVDTLPLNENAKTTEG